MNARLRRTLLCLAVGSLAPLWAGTPTPEAVPFERGRDKLRLELLAARTGLCALNVAAHPDDEDGAVIAWLRRIAGVEVHLCLSTRGEGGQNESGPELGAKLAALRTRESEAAAKILGEKVWYLNLPDFGYSKSKKETFTFWNKEKALGRLVRIIRIVQPDILFTNHNPAGKDHGHHQATGELVYEAFEAAADPKRFPKQITGEGYRPWKVSKLYRRLWKAEGATLKIELSRRDPSSGSSPAEIAAWAVSRHLSQGMRREVIPGRKVIRYFLLVKSRLGKVGKEKSLLDGFAALPDQPVHVVMPGAKLLNYPNVKINVERILGGAPGQIAKWSLFGLEAAQYVKKSLALTYAGGLFRERIARRVTHLSRAAAEALGLRLHVGVADPIIAPGEETGVTVRLANTGPLPIVLEKWSLASEPGWELGKLGLPKQPIPPGQFFETRVTIKATEKAYPSFPSEKYLGARWETRAPVVAEARVRVEMGAANSPGKKKVRFDLPRAEAPIQLAPAFEARFDPDPVLIFDDPDRDDDQAVLCQARLSITSHRRRPWTCFAQFADDPRFKTRDVNPAAFAFTREEQTLSAELRFSVTVKDLSRGGFSARTLLWTKDYDLRAFAPKARFRRVPLKLPLPLRVGVVRTYDAATWNALQRLAAQQEGLSVVALRPQDLRAADLNNLHTIILGLRAAQYRPDVRRYRERLHEFMRQGGNVVCLYHKDFDWNKKEEQARGRGIFRGRGGGGVIAPYPIVLSFDRVTDEKAPVRILHPKHPLLSRPCKIWEKDFAGWVQERGVYFPKKWDPRYTALLASHDPGSPPLKGGLLIAKVGRGSFIYTSYVWYRQLRAGVPGAYRMLANLIAYPRVKPEEQAP